MKQNREKLERLLEKIDASIAAHPYNAPDAVASREIVEQFETEGKERIEQELAAHGLPPLADTGRTVASGLFSFSRLHRKRQKLLKKLEKTQLKKSY